MPYAPGIQDISGQLLAQGMSQAGAARARSIESIGDSLASGIKQYQQNQSFTAQSLAKFTERMQDPEFYKYVNNILADDSNKMGVPESVKTAFRNAQTGKLKPNEASTLATIAQDYSERKKASEESDFRRMQTALAFVQAQSVLAKASAAPVGQKMTLEEYQKFLKANPDLSANAVPLGDGTVLMKGMTGRVAEKQDVTPVNIGGETVLIDKNTGQTVRTIANTSPIPAGFERVPVGPAAAPTASAVAAPASLGQFMSAGSMAPDQMGLPGSQGRAGMQPAAAPSPAAIAAIKAVQAAQGAAPAIARAPAGVPAAIAPALAAGVPPVAVRPIAGGPADIEAKQKAFSEQKARETLGGNISVAQNTIKQLEDRANKFSVGTAGSFAVALRLPDAKDVQSLLQTLEGNIAFDALRNLKDSGTTLGQVAIVELNMLKASKGAIEQAQSLPLFKEQLNRFKVQYEYAAKRLELINSDFEKGLTEPSKETLQKRKDLFEQEQTKLKSFDKTPEQRLTEGGTIKITKRPK
tara:strand:+ start:274 stop:1845 length:1572 start_codon:yes stop_codon:yes gene_type:complete